MVESESANVDPIAADAPTLLSYAAPDLQPNPLAIKTVYGGTWVAFGLCTIGAGWICLFAVEAVVIISPLLLVCASALLVASLIAKWPRAMALAFGHIGVCVLFFGLVKLLNWSPRRATMPFAWMSSVWTIAALAWSIHVLHRPPTPASASSRVSLRESAIPPR